MEFRLLNAPNAPVHGLRQRLRAATAEAHKRIDRRFGAYNLAHAADYRRFLEASAAALLPLEAALITAGVSRVFPDWPLRSRRTAILDDLDALDGELRLLPAPPSLDFGGVLGTMYVLEGSRLGAKLLVKTVQRSSDPKVAAATAYLRHGDEERLWPSFLAALERHAAVLSDDTSAVNGAMQAFELFERAAAATSDRRLSPFAEAARA